MLLFWAALPSIRAWTGCKPFSPCTSALQGNKSGRAEPSPADRGINLGLLWGGIAKGTLIPCFLVCSKRAWAQPVLGLNSKARFALGCRAQNSTDFAGMKLMEMSCGFSRVWASKGSRSLMKERINPVYIDYSHCLTLFQERPTGINPTICLVLG